MKNFTGKILAVFSMILLSGCETEEPFNTLTQSDLLNHWEIISASYGWYSIWTFKDDNTYTWYCDWPDRFDLSGSGTYYIRENKLHLTGVLPNSDIVGSIVELEVFENKQEFYFYDNYQEVWKYQVIDPEPEYSKNIPFYEQDSYTGDCASRPSNTTCLKFEDNYVWLVLGPLVEWKQYYGDHGYVSVGRGYEGFINNPIEYHHLINTNKVKRVRRYQ